MVRNYDNIRNLKLKTNFIKFFSPSS